MLVTIFLHILGVSCSFLYFTTAVVDQIHIDAEQNRIAQLVILVGFQK